MYSQSPPEQEKLKTFFSKATLHTYRKRELVLHANDTPLSVFFIEDGYIRVYKLSENGEELTLTILKPGDLFPLTFGMHQSVNQYFLESLTPLILRKAPQENFLTYIKEDQEMFYRLVTESFVRFEDFLTRMEYFMCNSAYLKVAAALLTCAKTLGRRIEQTTIIPVPLTHRDIATMIGITRETTSLEMKKLEKQGFIQKASKFIALIKLDVLEETLFPHELDSVSQTYF